jgi:hypothetical protein
MNRHRIDGTTTTRRGIAIPVAWWEAYTEAARARGMTTAAWLLDAANRQAAVEGATEHLPTVDVRR